MKNQEKAAALLRSRATALGRLPRRKDLTHEDLCCVKSAFGPLPRALEAAGLKEVSAEYARHRRHRLEKHQARRHKRQRTKSC